MTKLSVNINKFATLRNSRGSNNPNVLAMAIDCEKLGAQGITVHPRPDERHIRKNDVLELAKHLQTEFNIEGYPTEDFIALVIQAKATQVTLVPDAPEALTSSAGWNTVEKANFLFPIITRLKSEGIRVSIFVDPIEEMIHGAKMLQADRVELYTEPYARLYKINKEAAIAPYKSCAQLAKSLSLGLNAGHDLSMENLAYYIAEIPETDEVSIGHALVCDALYWGLSETIQRYRACLSV